MILRPKSNVINNKNDIIFQAIDWRSSDVAVEVEDENNSDSEIFSASNNFIKNRKFQIRGYGVTEEGHSISITINDFTPYFFFKIPQDWSRRYFKYFISALQNKVNNYHQDSLISSDIVKRKDFYGFSNNKLYKFGRLVFKNLNGFYSYQKAFKYPIYVGRLKKSFDFSKKLYENKVNPLLRFFHVEDIEPVGWIKLPAKKYVLNIPKTTRCQIDCSIHYNDIEYIKKNKICKLLVAAFDIECTSKDGSFPNPGRKEDEIIQIATTVYRFGEEKCALKHIVTLKKCDPIDGAIVESYYTEKDLLIAWVKFLEKLDPDILTGYNIWGFDEEYIYERAKTGNGGQIRDYSELLMRRLSRQKDGKCQFKEKELSSSALGNNFLKFFDIEGIVQIDLLKVVQKDYKLNSYKLDNVASVFMKQNKIDLSPKQLFANYKDGSSDKIKEIAVYCIKDCVLCNDLINKLKVIENNSGMGNVCLVPFEYLFLRGQGIKIFSPVLKQCRKENFLIKTLCIDDIDKNSYEGAIVFDPDPGIYFDQVAVMDYAALYPSSMIAENISHDSILGFKEYRLKKKSKKTDPDEYELYKDTINKEFDNLDDYNYNDIEYDVFMGIGDDKRKIGYKICRFAEKKNGEKSVLPRILQKLLKARKDTRKKIKYKTIKTKDGKEFAGMLKEGDDEYIISTVLGKTDIIKKSDVIGNIVDTYNAFEKAVLDGLQLSYKITCNSLYGQVGATTSSICYKELAACTTATGREMVIVARDITLANYKGSKLVYGDTDSIFVSFSQYIKEKYGDNLSDEEMMKRTIEVGEEAGALVTSKLKRPQVLEYEKVFWPFIIFSKKRYVGNKYEFNPHKFKQTSMGIVLKRRDNANIVKDIYGGIINLILNKRDIEGSKDFFRDEVRKLLTGDVDINKLIITKSIRGNYANPTLIPHKALADRMGKRDPGNKPSSNDRIPYCYIDKSNLKCTVCDSNVNYTKCKCLECTQIFCSTHIGCHKGYCKRICRFCKIPADKISLTNCKTCMGWYCGGISKDGTMTGCFKKHKRRMDKYKEVHYDKCKKVLSQKITQSDIVEHPMYIKEQKLSIDYNYYLEHQIKKPVFQIFKLTMKKPSAIIKDIVRKDTNKRNGNREITQWFKIIKEKNSTGECGLIDIMTEIDNMKIQIKQETKKVKLKKNYKKVTNKKKEKII